MKHALIVVDAQQGFINQVPKSTLDGIRQKMEDESNEFDMIVATKFVNENGSQFEKQLGYTEMMSLKEQELDSVVEKLSDIIVEKTTYAPSNSFYDMLRRNGIGKVTIIGLDIDGCVLATAFRCFDEGFNTGIDILRCDSGGGLDQKVAATMIMSRSFGDSNLYPHKTRDFLF